MRYLLELLTKELPQQAERPVQPNPKIRYTVVERVFQGQIQSQIRCLHCQACSATRTRPNPNPTKPGSGPKPKPKPQPEPQP